MASWFICDMGAAHVLAKDGTWTPIENVGEGDIEEGDYHRFGDYGWALEFCLAEFRRDGGHVRPCKLVYAIS